MKSILVSLEKYSPINVAVILKAKKELQNMNKFNNNEKQNKMCTNNIR